MKTDLILYSQRIKVMADNFSKDTFLNSSIEHAGIIFSNIFRKAENYVYIFAGDLNGGISSQNQYWYELVKFLSRNDTTKLNILLSNYKQGEFPDLFYRINEPQFKSKIDIRYTEEPFKIGDKDYHFCVSDDKMYRFETDIVLYLAQGSFNSPEIAKKLRSIFESNFENASKINIFDFQAAI